MTSLACRSYRHGSEFKALSRGMIASPHRPESRADRPGRTQHRPRVAAIATIGGPAPRPCPWPPRRGGCRGRESAEELAGRGADFFMSGVAGGRTAVCSSTARAHLDVCGLRSRCTIRCSCAASSASAICVRWGEPRRLESGLVQFGRRAVIIRGPREPTGSNEQSRCGY